MKISTKGRYGLRAILDVAQNSDQSHTVSVQSISDRQDISESYLEQLVRLLKNAGLIKSVRGAGGGYMLARSADDISVGDVLRACEGNIEVVSCTATDSGEKCSRAEKCVTRIVWDSVNKAIEDAVNSISIGKLIEDSISIEEKPDDKSVCIN